MVEASAKALTYNLFVGELICKALGAKSRMEMAERFLMTFRESEKTRVKDKDSLAEVIQVYLDRGIGIRKDVLSEIENNISRCNPKDVQSYIDILLSDKYESIFALSYDDFLAQNDAVTINKPDLINKGQKKAYKILGDLSNTDTIYISSQEIKRLVSMSKYGEFWTHVCQELAARPIVFAYIDFTDPDNIAILDYIVDGLPTEHLSMYMVVEPKDMSIITNEFASKYNIKILEGNPAVVLRDIEAYIYGTAATAPIVEVKPEVIEVVQRTIDEIQPKEEKEFLKEEKSDEKKEISEEYLELSAESLARTEDIILDKIADKKEKIEELEELEEIIANEGGEEKEIEIEIESVDLEAVEDLSFLFDEPEENKEEAAEIIGQEPETSVQEIAEETQEIEQVAQIEDNQEDIVETTEQELVVEEKTEEIVEVRPEAEEEEAQIEETQEELTEIVEQESIEEVKAEEISEERPVAEEVASTEDNHEEITEINEHEEIAEEQRTDYIMTFDEMLAKASEERLAGIADDNRQESLETSENEEYYQPKFMFDNTYEEEQREPETISIDISSLKLLNDMEKKYIEKGLTCFPISSSNFPEDGRLDSVKKMEKIGETSILINTESLNNTELKIYTYEDLTLLEMKTREMQLWINVKKNDFILGRDTELLYKYKISSRLKNFRVKAILTVLRNIFDNGMISFVSCGYIVSIDNIQSKEEVHKIDIILNSVKDYEDTIENLGLSKEKNISETDTDFYSLFLLSSYLHGNREISDNISFDIENVYDAQSGDNLVLEKFHKITYCGMKYDIKEIMKVKEPLTRDEVTRDRITCQDKEVVVTLEAVPKEIALAKNQ